MAELSSSDEDHVTQAPEGPAVKTSGKKAPQVELPGNSPQTLGFPPEMTNPHLTTSILCVPDEALRRISTTTTSNSLAQTNTRYLMTEAQSRFDRQASLEPPVSNEDELVMDMTTSEYRIREDSFSQDGPGSAPQYSFDEQLSNHRRLYQDKECSQEVPEKEEKNFTDLRAENLPKEKGAQEWVLPPPPPPEPMLPPPPAEGEWVTPLIAPERDWVPPPTAPQRGRLTSPMSSLEREWERVTPLTAPTDREMQVPLPPFAQVLPVVPQPQEEDAQPTAPAELAVTSQPQLPGPEPQPKEGWTPSRQTSEEDLLATWATDSNEFSVFLPAEKSESVAEELSKGTSRNMYEHPMVSHSEKEIVTRIETKAWPSRMDSASSDMMHYKPQTSVFAQRGKDKAFLGAMENITSQVKNTNTSSMANSISSFVDSPVGKVFADTIDRALDKSEEWLNYYLPLPGTSAADANVKKEERDTSKDDLCKEGCFVRINFLSTQLRNRVFRFVLRRLKATRQNTNEQLSRLDQVLNMLDHSLSPGPSRFQKVSESLSNVWSQWNTKSEAPAQKQQARVVQTSLSLMPEQLELKALTMTRVLADELYTTYRNLLPHVTELPAHLQEKVTRVYQNMEELHSHLSSVASLKDLPTNLILQSRDRITAARENLDELLEFMAHSQPGQWLSQASTSRTEGTLSSAGARPPITESVESVGKDEESTSQQRSPSRSSSSYSKESQPD